MPMCSVKYCKNISDHTSKTNIKFFSFPRNAAIVLKWLEVCKKKTNPKNARICSMHFTLSSYKEKPAYLIGCENYSPKKVRKLREDAVPIEHLIAPDGAYREENASEHSTDATPCEDSVSQLEDSKYFASDVGLNTNVGTMQDINFCSSEAHTQEISSSEHSKSFSSTHVEVCHVNSSIQSLDCAGHDSCLLSAAVSGETSNVVKLELSQKRFQNKLRQNNTMISDLKKRLEATRKENVVLKKELKRLQGDKTKLQVGSEKILRSLKKIFTEKQIQLLMNKKNKKRVKWGLNDIAAAISLRSISPRAYRYLRANNYPLPGLSTLRNWACRMDLNEGILDSILFLMKEKSSKLQLQEKVCMLCFDEVYISQNIDINKSKEQVIGPHKSVQVGMVRGLFSSWKQIIFYEFDKPLNTSIILNAIMKLYEAGYIVVAFTTDLGPSNCKALKQLNIGIEQNEKCFFVHPSNDAYKVFVFNDAPHLLKLVRNHFIDSGFFIKDLSINKDSIEEALSLNKNDLKVIFKITQDHLDVKGSNRQKVSTAAKLFSKTTARGVLWCGQQGFLKSTNFDITSTFLELIDCWFDVFNSKIITNKMGKEPYGLNVQKQNETLDKVSDFMLNMSVGKRNKLLPFQKGFILNNKSLQALLPYLQETCDRENFKIKFLLTNRLTQDIIENFFSYLRSMGIGHTHPSALNFQYRLRWYILGKHSGNLLEKQNTEEDHDSVLIDFNESENAMIRYSSQATKANFQAESNNDDGCLFPIQSTNYFVSAEEENDDGNEDTNNFIQDVIQAEALAYITGYVAYRFRSKYPFLADFTKNIQFPSEKPDWILTLSDGHLMYPSTDFLAAAFIMENVFQNIHGLFVLSKELGIFKKVTKLSMSKIPPENNIPMEVMLCLVRTRTYIRLRKMNLTVISNLTNRRNKTQKFCS